MECGARCWSMAWGRGGNNSGHACRLARLNKFPICLILPPRLSFVELMSRNGNGLRSVFL
jgi:hypothetical protein